MWPKTTRLLPVWPRDAKRLDTPGGVSFNIGVEKQCREAREKVGSILIKLDLRSMCA